MKLRKLYIQYIHKIKEKSISDYNNFIKESGCLNKKDLFDMVNYVSNCSQPAPSYLC